MKTKGPIEVPGNITISRVSCSSNNGYISIAIEDASSGCLWCMFEMGIEDFARCITGLGCVDGKLRAYPTAPIGKRREHKSEMIRFADVDDAKAVENTLSPFEVSGWQADRKNISNHHRQSALKDDGSRDVNVAFRRFVDAGVETTGGAG